MKVIRFTWLAVLFSAVLLLQSGSITFCGNNGGNIAGFVLFSLDPAAVECVFKSPARIQRPPLQA